jgi:hypothetical protein
VKHGAIVPEVVSAAGQWSVCDVGACPMNFLPALAEAGSRRFQGGVGQVEHCDVRVPAVKEVVDEGRRATADIDHGGGLWEFRGIEKRE